MAYRPPTASGVAEHRDDWGRWPGGGWAGPGSTGAAPSSSSRLLAFLGFLTLPIRITTIYSGLPAHPLFVHVPVVLIPTTVVAAVVFVFKREWLARYGIALAVVSIVAMSWMS